jgi:hypothetical protein
MPNQMCVFEVSDKITFIGTMSSFKTWLYKNIKRF